MEIVAGIEYRDCPGLLGYRVGSDGSVWSRWRVKSRPGFGTGSESFLSKTWRQLTPVADRDGYLRVCLQCDGKQLSRTVHCLVLEGFVGKRPSGMQGCHNDGDRANNQPNNLRWDTPRGNNADKKRHGTEQCGERHPGAKLTHEDAKIIQHRLATEGRGVVQRLADEYRVKRWIISQIRNGKHWSCRQT